MPCQVTLKGGPVCWTFLLQVQARQTDGQPCRQRDRQISGQLATVSHWQLTVSFVCSLFRCHTLALSVYWYCCVVSPSSIPGFSLVNGAASGWLYMHQLPYLAFSPSCTGALWAHMKQWWYFNWQKDLHSVLCCLFFLQLFYPRILVLYVLGFTGALFYATKFPEIFIPGCVPVYIGMVQTVVIW